MTTVLRIADVCRQLRRSPDCIRDWVRRGILSATRSPSGQLQFDPADVQAIKDGARAPSRPSDGSQHARSSQAQQQGQRRWQDLAPWEQDVARARASVQIERLSQEAEVLDDARSVAAANEGRRNAQEAEARAELERLTGLKQWALANAWVPTAMSSALAASLDQFVTSANVPKWLTRRQQEQSVLIHLGSVRDKALEEQRAATEAAEQREREAQQERLAGIVRQVQSKIEAQATGLQRAAQQEERKAEFKARQERRSAQRQARVSMGRT